MSELTSETRRVGRVAGAGNTVLWAGNNPENSPLRPSPQAVSDRRLFAITLGDSKSCEIWKHRLEMTWDEFSKRLSVSPPGAKDGPCYTPAIFKGHNYKRQLPFVERMDVAVLDSDCGHTLAEIATAVRDSGFAAIIHSTHSHLVAATEVALSSLEKHNGDAEAVMRAKGFLPRVVSGCQKTGEIAGVKLAIILHEPCPRFRIVFPLLEPWRKSKADAGCLTSLGFKPIRRVLIRRGCFISPEPGQAARLTNSGTFAALRLTSTR